MHPNYYQEKIGVLPVLFIRGVVCFPGQMQHLELESEDAESSLEWAVKNDSPLLLVSMKDPSKELYDWEDFYQFGTIVHIRQHFRLPGGSSTVIVEGSTRAKLTDYARFRPYIEGKIVSYEYDSGVLAKDSSLRQRMELVAKAGYSYLQDNVQIPKIFLYSILEEKDPEELTNTLASNLDLSYKDAQKILSELDLKERLDQLLLSINLLTQLKELQKKITDQAQERLKQSQKDYVLREQISLLKSELGEDNDPESPWNTYAQTFQDLHLPAEVEEAVHREMEKLSYLSPMSPEQNVVRAYLDTLIELPWGKETEDQKSLVVSQAILDRDHYGLKDVKERILEYLAVRQLKKDAKGSILCFVGPPGVGKTSIAKSIARAMNRSFVSMRLGGVTDESEIRGHRRTYIGSMPGRIINLMIKAKSMNPVFLLDEVDKLGRDFRGDPASALLEVLDPAQNFAFQDHYLEVPFDLSKVMFLTTANSVDGIPAPLLDRMEIVEIPGYTDQEKEAIAKKYLVPKAKAEAGIRSNQLYIGAHVLPEIIRSYTRESGVRELERQIKKLCRKAARALLSGEHRFSVSQKNLTSLLGPIKYFDDPLEKKPEIGVVNGLAWTEVGGELLKVEVNLMAGRGSVLTTGSIGSVMQESAQISLTYARANASRYGISPNFHNYYDIHIHMPEGAVPKDGPSAGVTMLCALVSALTKRPVRKDVAMTGELTLTGRVLPVGGVREKILAAKRYGILEVYLPKENLRELEEMDPQIREGMHFHPVDQVDQIVAQVLLNPVEEKKPMVFQPVEEPKSLGFRQEPSPQLGSEALEPGQEGDDGQEGELVSPKEEDHEGR